MWGWRHFQVTNRKNQKAWVFAEMVAACDNTVRFWVNAKSLKDRTLWMPGWQSLSPQDDEKNTTKGSENFMSQCNPVGREGLDDDFLIDLD